jgi:GntR family transcriptional regulator, transcriptional repressor for pyruvate dehydrogenase complex
MIKGEAQQMTVELANAASEGGTLVARTARALAEFSLAQVEGAYLGAEDDLLGRLGVSRPTLRQAAKIVESDRLISVRRGLHGGFYAERPNAADSIRALTRYLRLNGASLADIIVVTRPVSEEAGVQAAMRATAEQKERLRAFARQIDSNDSRADIVLSETELGRLLAEMSGNPAIQLFMEIGFTFGMEEQGLGFFSSAEQRAETRAMQHRICDAILSGDGEITRLMMQRRGKMVTSWLEKAMAQTNEGVEAE